MIATIHSQIEQFLGWLLRVSWQASILVGVVLLAQYLLKNHLSPRWRCGLWLVVLARLVCPSFPESPFSLFNVTPEPERIVSRVSAPFIFEADRDESLPLDKEAMVESSAANSSVTSIDETEVSTPSTAVASHRSDWKPIVAGLWLLGSILLMTFTLGQIFTTQFWYRRLPEIEDRRIRALLDECRVRMGVRKNLRLVEAPSNHSPALMGLFNPTIVLPNGIERMIGYENLRFVFLHELGHHKRKDIWVNWLATLLKAMHWFNPVLWFAMSRLRTDQELACDHLALSYTEPGEAKRYSQAIFVLFERSILPQRIPGVAGILEEPSRMRRRIQTIADFRRPSPAWTAVTLALLSAMTLVSLTDANTDNTFLASHSSPPAIEFPTDLTLVSIWVRDWGSESEEDWVFLAKAQGAVTVPASKEVFLHASVGHLKDLSFLSLLNPESVRKLDLEGLSLDDPSLNALTNFTHLRSLNLKNVGGLSAGELEPLSHLPHLQKLNLYGVPAGDAGLAYIGGLANLEHLNIERTGITDAGLASISGLTNLRGLTLSRTNISDEGLLWIEPLDRLEYLDLWSCDIGDSGLSSVAKLGSLKHLEIARTRITDEGIEHLCGLRELESLHLYETGVTDACLPVLTTLPSLRELVWNDTGITYEGLRRFNINALPEPGNSAAPSVGIIFSKRLTEYGYDFTGALRMADYLREAGFDLYAVVETETGDDPVIAEAALLLGLQDRIIDGSDISRMKDLDAILCVLGWCIDEKLIDSLVETVEAGTGFMSMMPLGLKSPGYSEQIQKLLGVVEPRHIWRRGYFLAPVIAYHPILGMLEPGDEFWIRTANGYGGVIDGTPLLGPPEEVVRDGGEDDSSATSSGRFAEDYSPLYVRQYGEGRVVVFQTNEQDPADLKPTQPYSVVEFYARCINWAAKRPVGTKWTSETTQGQDYALNLDDN